MDILDTPTRPQVGADIERLARHLRGLGAIRRRLAAWARAYAAENPRALAPDRLRDAMRCLVTLAHANASASLEEPAVGGVARPEVRFDDLGGYRACLLSLVDVLDSFPIPESEIAELQRHARTFRVEQPGEIRLARLEQGRGSRTL